MALIDVLLPPSCAGCGRYGSLLCDVCRTSFRSASPAAVTFVQSDPGLVVGEALTLAVAALRYEGSLRRSLQRLKYGGGSRLAAPLGEASAAAFERLLAISGPAPLVPVPVHVLRLRERGYNQAALLAAELGRRFRLPVAEILVRSRPTTRQHRLDRAARLRNLQQAFVLRPGRAIPSRVILVDDILTTSATLEACAGVLRSAGCRDIFGFALAREV